LPRTWKALRSIANPPRVRRARIRHDRALSALYGQAYPPLATRQISLVDLEFSPFGVAAPWLQTEPAPAIARCHEVAAVGNG